MDDGVDPVTTDAACAAEEDGRDDRAADGSEGPPGPVQWWKRPPRPPPCKADAEKDKKKHKRKAGEQDVKVDLGGGDGRPAVVQRTLMDFDKTPRRPQYEAPRPRGHLDLEVHGYWRRRDGSLLYKFPNGETRVAHGTDEWPADLL